MHYFTPLFIAILSSFIYEQTSAGYRANLKFIRFQNPTGRLYTGGKCEGSTTNCDHYFKLCVGIPASSSSLKKFSNCFFKKDDAKYDIEENDIYFQTSNTGIPTTITPTGKKWPGTIRFYMEVWDDDSVWDDLVEQYSYSKSITPGVNGTSTLFTVTINGQRPKYLTYLTFSIDVYCFGNYYGSNCETYCRYQDDSKGHYKCNNKGERICLNGWYKKPNCLTYCMPRDDDINGHYTCSSTGSRICRKDWFNLPKCLTKCVPRDDIHGHFTCDKTGSRVCMSNWYDLPNCTTYCQPHDDDVNGHYTCSDKGTPICRNGWHGENCTVYCVPTADARGHYNCSNKGDKICHDNWYGDDCNRYCKASSNKTIEHRNNNTSWFRNDSNTSGHHNASDISGYGNTSNASRYDNNTSGYYTCSSTGEKICFANYYGVNCTVFCYFSNTSNQRFTCDPKTGEAKCLKNWTGRSCNISRPQTTHVSSLASTDSIIHSSITPSLLSSSMSIQPSISIEKSSVTPIQTPTSSILIKDTFTTTVPTPTPSSTFPSETYYSPQTSMALSTKLTDDITSTLTHTQTSIISSSFHSSSTALKTSSSSTAMFIRTSSKTVGLNQTRITLFRLSTSRQLSTSAVVTTSNAAPESTSVFKKPMPISSIRHVRSVLPSHWMEPSKSIAASRSSVYYASKAIEQSKKSRNIESTNWLLETDDGKLVLGGSAVAFFLLVALTIAVVMYLRMPKRPKPSQQNYKKSLENKSNAFDLDDLMENAVINPLYDVHEGALAKETSSKGKSKKKKKEKDDTYYVKPRGPKPLLQEDSVMKEHDDSKFGVVQNPLYGMTSDFDTGV